MAIKTSKEPRPKRTKSKAAAEPASEPSALPTADALALIAANVSKGIDLEPRLAVDYAFKLWKNAREKLDGEIKECAPVPGENETIQPGDSGGLPSAFPATFDTFLRLVVNAKTLDDATERFRDFLRSNPETEAEADKRMAKLGNEGFKDAAAWQVTALEYHHWWQSQQPSAAGQSAASPLPPPKNSLPTFETFLRTVVKGETDADSENKFRAFLRSKLPEPAADEQLAQLTREGFKNIGIWLETAREYREWSKSEKPA